MALLAKVAMCSQHLAMQGSCTVHVDPGSVELQIAWRLMGLLEEDAMLSESARADISSRVSDLLSGALRLPFEHICALPAAILCPNGCADVYCCSRCAAEAWQRGHCLLCAAAAAGPRDVHLRNLRGCPYIRPFDAAALQKFGHDRSVFGWMLEPTIRQGGSCTAAVRPGLTYACGRLTISHDLSPVWSVSTDFTPPLHLVKPGRCRNPSPDLSRAHACCIMITRSGPASDGGLHARWSPPSRSSPVHDRFASCTSTMYRHRRSRAVGLQLAATHRAAVPEHHPSRARGAAAEPLRPPPQPGAAVAPLASHPGAAASRRAAPGLRGTARYGHGAACGARARGDALHGAPLRMDAAAWR